MMENTGFLGSCPFHEFSGIFQEFPRCSSYVVQGRISVKCPIFQHELGRSPGDMISTIHRIGLWENLQESPVFDGKNHGFL